MKSPIMKMENRITLSGYLLTALVIALLAVLTAVVNRPYLKVAIGIGFALAFFASISYKPHRYPLISAALLFACWAIVTELYRDGGDRNAGANHYFYMLASLCLIVGILKQYYSYHRIRKGGSPQPPNP